MNVYFTISVDIPINFCSVDIPIIGLDDCFLNISVLCISFYAWKMDYNDNSVMAILFAAVPLCEVAVV